MLLTARKIEVTTVIDKTKDKNREIGTATIWELSDGRHIRTISIKNPDSPSGYKTSARIVELVRGIPTYGDLLYSNELMSIDGHDDAIKGALEVLNSK